MSVMMTIAVGISAVLTAAMLFYWARRSGNWRLFGFELGCLLAFLVILNSAFDFPFPETVTAKGKAGTTPAAATLLYSFMLLGMVFRYLHRHFSEPEAKRPKIDWGVLVAPVFASPVVFIPLLAAF